MHKAQVFIQRRVPFVNLMSYMLLTVLFFPLFYSNVTFAAEEQSETSVEDVESTRIDRAQKAMGRGVNQAARWIDSFFLDERYVTEEAYSRIRLTPSVFLEEGEAADYKFRVNAKINVPKFSKKLKLIISSDSDDDQDGFGAGTDALPDSPASSSDEGNVGLQYFFREKAKINTSLSTGIKLLDEHGVDAFIGPRLRRTVSLNDGNTQLRFTERVRLYTDIGWESVTGFDVESLLPGDLFFRGTVEGRWREEDEGYRYEFLPTITQQLQSKSAIEYQWYTTFVTEPKHRLEQTTLRLRYRQQKWRKWLFFEINPQLSFVNDDNLKPTPGIEFRIEASFGGLGLDNY
jgi:hypothetical protein